MFLSLLVRKFLFAVLEIRTTLPKTVSGCENLEDTKCHLNRAELTSSSSRFNEKLNYTAGH